MTAATQTVREIAQTQPSSIRVFEQFGIEYCCGGRKPLAEACAEKDIAVEIVIAALEAACRKENAQSKDWTKEPLANLTEHIVAKHHAYCKEELPRLSGLAAGPRLERRLERPRRGLLVRRRRELERDPAPVR